MALNLQAQPVVEGLEKNCSRCGTDFTDYTAGGLMRVCLVCKRPKKTFSRYQDPGLRGKPLTKRQQQVVALIAEGMQNKEVGHRLHLGEGTIKVAVSTILAKTGHPNRTKLAVWWAVTHL